MRIAGLVALLGAVVLMHIGLFSCSDPQMPTASSSVTVSTAAHTGHAVMEQAAAAGESHHAGMRSCGEHAMLHGCVFLITAFAAAVMALALVGRLGVTGFATMLPCVYWLTSARNRAPPWLAPSLAELSILRV